MPSAIVVVDELPLTPGGKVDLGALPAPPSRSESFEARTLDDPGDDTERRLCDTFAGVLRLDQFGVNESFFELGGHSLLAVRLLGRLRRDLGHHVSLSTLYGAPTPRELAAEIRSGHTGGYSHLIPIKPTGSLTPIFGVHVLGTNASYYRPLAARLDAERPLHGLSFSELDENTPTDIATIAATYAVELERFRPTGPIVIAAVSLGGYVAFELAQQLVAKGRHVAVLAVFDGAGPGGRPQASRARRLRIHLRQLRHGRLTYLRSKVRGVTERVATSAGARRARVRAATGRTLPDALRRHAFVQANVVAADAYAASPYPGPITVFRATGELFDAPEVAKTGLGWSVVAGGGIDVVDVPGDHMSIFDEPFVATLASELDTVVRSACHEPDANPRSSAVSNGS